LQTLSHHRELHIQQSTQIQCPAFKTHCSTNCCFNALTIELDILSVLKEGCGSGGESDRRMRQTRERREQAGEQAQFDGSSMHGWNKRAREAA